MSKKLIFRYSVMNAGKSLDLLRTAHNYKELDKTVVIMKPLKDDRSGAKIESRIGIAQDVNVLIDESMDVFEHIKHMKEYTNIDTVLVDEVQMLTIDQIEQLFRIAVLLKVDVICYGLRINYIGKPFKASKHLLGLAHEIQELKTLCRNCGDGKATMHLRMVDGRPVFEGEEIIVGDEEYIGVCPKCWFEAKHNEEK